MKRQKLSKPTRKDNVSAKENRILEAIRKYEGLHDYRAPRIETIARIAGMKRPTVVHYLESMRRRELVEKKGEGRYRTANPLDVLADYFYWI